MKCKTRTRCFALLLILISLFVSRASGVEQTFWVDGNAEGVFVARVLPPQEQEEGQPSEASWQLLYRSRMQDGFHLGRNYRGRPAAVAAVEEGLVVVYESGYIVSYQGRRYITQQRLPEGLTCVAVAGGDRLAVLARAAQNVSLAAIAGEASQAGPGVPAISFNDVQEANNVVAAEAATGSELTLAEGQHVLLVQSPGGDWDVVCVMPELAGNNGPVVLARNGSGFHVFAANDKDSGGITCWHLREGQAPVQNEISVGRVDGLQVVTINKQLRLLIGQEQNGQMQFLMGWPQGDQWKSVAVESAGQPWTITDAQVRWGALDQQLIVLCQQGNEPLRFAYCDVNGQLDTAWQDVLPSPPPFSLRIWRWIYGPQAGVVVVVLMLGVLARRRMDAFSPQVTVPDHVELAPIWRRMGAYCMDLFPPMLVMMALFPNLLEELPPPEVLLEQVQAGEPSLLILQWYGLFSLVFTGYTTLTEMVFAATPGKLMLQLVVLSEDGRPARLGQIILRNLTRLFVLHLPVYFLILFTMVQSRRRQRVGDLLGKTMVALNTPELRMTLVRLAQHQLERSGEGNPGEPGDYATLDDDKEGTS